MFVPIRKELRKITIRSFESLTDSVIKMVNICVALYYVVSFIHLACVMDNIKQK